MSSVVTNYNGEYKGSGLSIVIIDTGSSNYYPNDNVIYGYDFADNDDDVSSTAHSHGGAVASIARDVASDVNIIHLKVFSDNSDGAKLNDVEKALQWVTQNSEEYNIAAVNMSLGASNVSSYMQDGWQLDDEYKDLDDLDIITTVAAGNAAQAYGQDGISYLAASESVIAVSAVNSNNEFAYFSQKHTELTDISAFGQHVPLDGVLLSGTSFSAPIVAGAAAIIQEIALDNLGHKISDEQFLDLIQKTADTIDPATYENSENDGGSNADSSQQSSISSVVTITPDQDPGGTIHNAYELNPSANEIIISDSLAWNDDKDFYSFTLDNTADVDFNLTDLAGDVDLILKDAYGQTLIHKWAWGNADLDITATLQAGQTYHIVTDSWDKKSTDYKLSIDFNGGIAAEEPEPPEEPDTPDTPDTPDEPEEPDTPEVDVIEPDQDPGGTIHSAYELDPSANEIVISDSLAWNDDKDFYSFTLNNTAEVDFNLTDLVGDVDLILKDASGKTLIHKWAWGNADLDISATLQAGQTYHIVTDSWDKKSTDYKLSIDFNGGIAAEEPEPQPDEPDTPDQPEQQPNTPPGYASINIDNAVSYFQENIDDYAVV